MHQQNKNQDGFKRQNIGHARHSHVIHVTFHYELFYPRKLTASEPSTTVVFDPKDPNHRAPVWQVDLYVHDIRLGQFIW